MGTRLAWSNRSRSPFGYGLLACAALLAACGGAAPPASAPEVASQPHVESEANDTARSDDRAAPEEAAPQAISCSDGTCSSCGAGICPSGWYCDESAKGGAACGWLPQCSQKPSCACLTRVLGAGCSCSEQGSGLHVTCQ